MFINPIEKVRNAGVIGIILLAALLIGIPLQRKMQTSGAKDSEISQVSICLEEGFCEVYAGEKQHLRIETSGDLSLPEDLTWTFSSSDPNLAAITPDGLLTPLQPGTVTITASACKNQTPAAFGQLLLRVQADPKPEITLLGQMLEEGSACSLNTGTFALPEISWYGEYTCRTFSSDPSTAQISSDGRITALKPGVTRIRFIFNRSGRYTVQEQSFSFRLKVLPWLERNGSDILICYRNNQDVHTSADLLSGLKLHGASGSDVRFKVKDTSLGSVKDGLYIPNTIGRNIVTASLGQTSVRFTIDTYRWLAHRGFSDQYPENTLDAFIGAAKAGAFSIETDLRLTSDHHWVCFHDDYTACLMDTPEDDRISDHTLSELQTNPQYRICAGNNIDAYTENLPCIPTLEEYLQICSQYGTYACIELKTPLPDPDTALQAMEALRAAILEYGMEKRCLIVTLDPEAADAFEAATTEPAYIREDYPLGDYVCCSFRTDPAVPTSLSMVSCEYDLTAGRANLPWEAYHKLTPLYHPGLF